MRMPAGGENVRMPMSSVPATSLTASSAVGSISRSGWWNAETANVTPRAAATAAAINAGRRRRLPRPPEVRVVVTGAPGSGVR